MTAISAGDLTIMRSGSAATRYYLSVAPREPVFSAVVTAVVQDAVTNGIYALDFGSGAGTLAAALPGYTIDVGTAAGANDVGVLRVRKAPIAGRIYVAETAPGDARVEVGQHLTVRRERRVWQRLPYLHAEAAESAFDNLFTMFVDYDLAYTNQNDAIQPHANITSDAAGNPARPADFVDAGQTYRTVTLHAGTSLALAAGAAIAAYLWDVGDGTITVGSTTSAAISARFPAGFRYIALTVTDTNGTAHTRYLPVWTHDAGTPPLTTFDITRLEWNEQIGGWEFALEFFGGDSTITDAQLPRGTTLCLWKVTTFGATATPAPACMVNARIGWLTRDALVLRVGGRSRYIVEVGGVATWLAQYATFPQGLTGVAGVPTAWHEIQKDHLSVDVAVHWHLRVYAVGVLDQANFYPSGVTDVGLTIGSKDGSVLSTVRDLATSARLSSVRADALNGLWLRRDVEFLDTKIGSPTDRIARGTTLTLASVDWRDARPLEFATSAVRPVGVTVGDGGAVSGAGVLALAGRAPGLTPGYGAGRATMPGQYLPASGTQDVLNALIGNYHAAQNSTRPVLRIDLLHPIDAIEPAWNERIGLLYGATTIRGGTSMLGDFYLARSISISFDKATRRETVAWSLALATIGYAAEIVDVQATTITPPPDVVPPHFPPWTPETLGRGTGTIGMFTTSNQMAITRNFSASIPTWSLTVLSALANWAGGTLLDFAVDAYSQLYLRTGTAVNGWIVTTAGVQRITDIFGTPALGTATALYGSSPVPIRQIQFERGVQNWGIVASYQPATGVRIAYTLNGTTWTEVAITAFYDNGGGGTNSPKPGLWLDPHRAGHAQVTAFAATGTCTGLTSVVYESVDYGASWAVKSGWDAGDWLAGNIVVPYQDTGATTVYHGWSVCVSTFDHRLYRNATDISPVVAGTSYGVEAQGYGWRRMAVSDVDANTLALVGAQDALGGIYGVFRTHNASAGAPTWQTLIAPSASMPYRGVYVGDRNLAYLIGYNGAIAQVDGTTVNDKKGALSTGTVVGICGG